MATPADRRIEPKEIRQFGTQKTVNPIPLPDLTQLQTNSYHHFLQVDTPPGSRKDQGVEMVLREIFPIENFDKTARLEYIHYELDKPRYEPEECRQLRLTYGRPFKVRLRLIKDDVAVEGDVYFGELPIMQGGGEFIINGAERVVVSQLHRSPGIDFVSESDGERKTYSCRVIPERGSWIELHISRKETIVARIDQSSKLPVMQLLRAMDKKYSKNADILRHFYGKKRVISTQTAADAAEIEGKVFSANVSDPANPEMEVVGRLKNPSEIVKLVEARQVITPEIAETLCANSKIQTVEVFQPRVVSLCVSDERPSTAISAEIEGKLFYKDVSQSSQSSGIVNTKKGTLVIKSWQVITKGIAQKMLKNNEVTQIEVIDSIHQVVITEETTPDQLEGKIFTRNVTKDKSPQDVFPTDSDKVLLKSGDVITAKIAKELCKHPKTKLEVADCRSVDVTSPSAVSALTFTIFVRDITDPKKPVENVVAVKTPLDITLKTGQVITKDIAKMITTSAITAVEVYEHPRIVSIASGASVAEVENKVSVEDVAYPAGSERSGEIIVESGQVITRAKAEILCTSGIRQIEVIDMPRSKLLLNSLDEDKTTSHEDALLRIYQRLRPGNPPILEKARELFREKFFDITRYRLGRVGRFRINRKLKLNIPLDVMTLRPEDVVEAVRYVDQLWSGDRNAEVDDIDHLGNRRLRTIDELAGDELRKGFLKLRRSVQERMSLREELTPHQVINQKSISSAIEYFFGRGELSQVVDQTNPLSMLTHERRLSALGPGGLNRKRAGFDVRDVHSSHYGRICPIETPEGTNIGLISSLAIYAGVDEFGFLIAPYRRVKNGVLQPEVDWLRADEEHEKRVVPADVPLKNGKKIMPDEVSELVISRYRGDYVPITVEEVDYIDVSPTQMIGVSAGLIPFLEHDDANRALMGSNMQRQAVPLLLPEPALVVTGLEKNAAYNSSLLIQAKNGGTVTYVDAMKIVITGPTNEDTYKLRKFVGMNERTCQNQTPIINLGDKVEKGQTIADGASMRNGELCLGRNILAGFMAWDGFNFEDAIILSEDIVQKDTYTSLHIEEFDTEIRDTKLGREEFTRDIPNIGDKLLRNLDENGIIRVGTYVRPGDILVGKVTPKTKTELTPEEKLLYAIFGRAGEDVKNESLEVPSGIEGIVIGTQKFACRMSLADDERKAFDSKLSAIERDGSKRIAETFAVMIAEMEKVIGEPLRDEDNSPFVMEGQDYKSIAQTATLFRMTQINLENMKPKQRKEVESIYQKNWHTVETAIDNRDRKLNSEKRGEELKRGVLQMVKVYIATKRVISVGDKMAGRHGNKGVIAKILPREDMPFLEDGTPIQIMLNPLGVPSRMNVGQILETHLGWAAAKLGYQAVTPVFDGATESEINDCLVAAGLPRNGKVQLYDGRSGEPFDQKTTVGYIYMLKLHHLVDDKVHARSTGPYSLITQQPLGGKARSGGQRFGEMEVWALEAYGAAYTLQELLTVKSDDVEGRTKIYESMVKGENTLEAGTPASFDVLTNEIRGLALNMQLEKGRV